MIISERVAKEIDNSPKTAKFTTEYFLAFDKSDQNDIQDILVKYQSNLPKLMEELNTIGYGVHATVLKSGRVLIEPRKKDNNDDGAMVVLMGSTLLSLMLLFACFVVKLVELFL